MGLAIRQPVTHKVGKVVTYKRITLVIWGTAIAFWSFFAGGFFPSVFDDRLAGMTEIPVEEIVVDDNGRLVGEFTMYSEDENVRIYRGEGSYDD